MQQLQTYPDQDTLVLEVDVSDGELVGERHCRESGGVSFEYCLREERQDTSTADESEAEKPGVGRIGKQNLNQGHGESRRGAQGGGAR